jgi:hypothetical protein
MTRHQRLSRHQRDGWKAFPEPPTPRLPSLSPRRPQPGLSLSALGARRLAANVYAGIISAEYRRYAEVARKLAKQQQRSDGFMWAQLAALWDKVADRKAAEEAHLLTRCETQNNPPDESDA